MKTTITLHPIPAGRVLFTEGDIDHSLYRMEGGLVAVKRGDVELFRAGPGAMLGAAGMLLAGPQLFTVVGVDKTSFAKRLVVDDVEELLRNDPEALGLLLGALATETSFVEARALAREPAASSQFEEAVRHSASLAGRLTGDMADRAIGKQVARAAAAGSEVPQALAVTLMRRTLHAIDTARALRAVSGPAERTRRTGAILKEHAQALAKLVSP